MKSLPKYKSIGKHETPVIERKDKDKCKNNHGNSHQNDKYMSPEKIFTEKKAYRYLNMIGKGGFGKVWKVEHLSTGRLFAMKEMSKAMYFLFDVESYRSVVLTRFSTKENFSQLLDTSSL